MAVQPGVGQVGGQTFSVLRSIQKLLEQMAENGIDTAGTVIKELLQNADDAGATELSVILDERQLPRGLDPNYSELFAPALLIRNNAPFRLPGEGDDRGDFAALCDVANGHKRDHATAAGRFGIGFNSVYFLTDTPLLFSRREVHIFDLANRVFAAPAAGWRFDLNSFPADAAASAGSIKTVLEWCFPKAVLGSRSFDGLAGDTTADYNQTVLRLPLRRSAPGEPGIQVDRFTDDQARRRLLMEMAKEASRSLLFLKSTRSVSFGVLSRDGRCETVVTIEADPVPTGFGEFLRTVKACSTAGKGPALSINFKRAITRQCGPGAELAPEIWRFHVWHSARFDDVELMQLHYRLSLNKERAVPWAALAVPLDLASCRFDGDGTARWRVFLPLVEQGPSNCVFNAALFVGPSRKYTEFKVEGADDEMRKTAWNKLLVDRALVPILQEVSLELPDIASDLLRDHPAEYLALFPRVRPDAQATGSGLSAHFGQTFCGEAWALRLPDLWGDQFDILMGETASELVLERVPRWLAEYGDRFSELSTSARRFVPEVLGAALSSRIDQRSSLILRSDSADVALAVLKHQEPPKAKDLKSLFRNAAKQLSTSDDLQNCWAFERSNGSGLLRFDSGTLYIVGSAQGTTLHPALAALQTLGLEFADTEWVRADVGLGAPRPVLGGRPVDNIVEPSAAAILRLLARLPANNAHDRVTQASSISAIVDFLVAQEALPPGLKLGFMVRTAANKVDRRSSGVILVRPAKSNELDEILWDLWFKKLLPEVDPTFAKPLHRLLAKHPNCLDSMHSDECKVLLGTADQALAILNVVRTRQPSVFGALSTRINDAVALGQVASAVAAWRLVVKMLAEAEAHWDEFDDSTRHTVLALPIHRMPTGGYTYLADAFDDDRASICRRFRLQPTGNGVDIADAPIAVPTCLLLHAPNMDLRRFYRKRLQLEEQGRVAVLKDVLDQIGRGDDGASARMLEYLAVHYQRTVRGQLATGDEMDAADARGLQERFALAMLVPCLDGVWRTARECTGASGPANRLKKQKWSGADVERLIPQLYPSKSIVRLHGSSCDWLRQLGVEPPELEAEGIARQAVSSESSGLSLRDRARLLLDNWNERPEPIEPMAAAVRSLQAPILTGRTALEAAVLLGWRPDLPDAMLPKLVPNAVDVKVLAGDLAVAAKDVPRVLQALGVTQVGADDFDNLFAERFVELWPRQAVDRLQVLHYVARQKLAWRLVEVAADLECVLVETSPAAWRRPAGVVAPIWMSTLPPHIPKDAQPRCVDVSDDVRSLWNDWCGINSFDAVLSRVLAGAASSRDSRSAARSVYTWIESESVASRRDDHALARVAWVLATCAGELRFLRADQVLLHQADKILGARFWVPAIPLPVFAGRFSHALGFSSKPPATEATLQALAECLSLPGAARDPGDAESVYELLLATLQDRSNPKLLSEIWPEIAHRVPVFLSFRATPPQVTARQLFIGDEEFKVDLSPKLLCLQASEISQDRFPDIYHRLGIPLRPTVEQVIFALSHFDGNASNLKAVYTALVRALVKLDIGAAATIRTEDLAAICALTCAGTLEPVSHCYWDEVVGKKSRVGIGADRLVDTAEIANQSLVKWLSSKGFIVRSLREAAELAADEPPSRVLESPELTNLLYPWRQWLAEAARDGSALREELTRNKLVPPAEALDVLPVERICLRYKFADGSIIEQAARWEGPAALSDTPVRLLVRIPKQAGTLSIKDLDELDKVGAAELAGRLGASGPSNLDATVELILRTLERPSTVLRRLYERNRKHSLHQYQDQNADLEFASIFEQYNRTAEAATRRREELEQELNRLLVLGFVRGRREQIRGYGYDEFSVFAELLQNAEDAYIQGAQLGMNTAEQCSIAYRFLPRDSGSPVLEVEHFGRPFNYWQHGSLKDLAYSRDVEGVLRSAGSFKPLALSSDTGGVEAKTIGRFGLGFKSVYLLTDQPEIHSGAWHFAIEAGCLPKELPVPANLPSGATRFTIPFREDAAVEVDPGRLVQLLPFLVRVQVLDFHGEDGACVSFATESASRAQVGATVVDLVTLSGPVPGRAHGARLLRCRSQEHSGQLALLLAEDGTPTRWDEVFGADMYAALPLRANLGCGLAVSHRFEVQSGRTHLVDPTTNAKRFADIAALVPALVEGVRACAGDTCRLGDLLIRFWAVWRWDKGDVESSQLRRDIASALVGAAEAAKIVPTRDLDVAVNLTDAQLFYFSELPDSFRDAVVGAGVTVRGDREVPIALSAQNVVADRFASAYRRAIEAAGTRSRSGIAKVAWQEISTACKERAWLAERPELLGALADSIPEDQVDKVADWLKDCEILAEDGSNRSVRAKPPVLLNREFPGSAHLALRWLTRPSAKYSLAASQLLNKAGVRSSPSCDQVREWLNAKVVKPDECVGVLSYLAEDNRFHKFEELEKYFQTPWFPAVGGRLTTADAVERKLLPTHLLENLTFRAWIGAAEAAPPPAPLPPAIQRPSAKVVLERLFAWWQQNGRQWTSEYERRLYPIGRPPSLALPFAARDRSQRRDWVTFLLLGALHTMGRTQPEQHRDFLRRCDRKGWLDIFADPDHNAKAWFRILEEYVDDPSGKQDYHQWMKQFITIFQVSRWLPEYVEAFQSVGRLRGPFGLDALTAPRTNPQFAGGGPDAPPLSRALGMGACFVLRELHRAGHVDQQLAHRYCFVPVRRVCDLLADLGCTDIRTPFHADKSSAAYRFLVEKLDLKRATFGRSFDLPLLALADSPELQSEILGVEQTALGGVLPSLHASSSSGDGDWRTLWDGRKVPINR